MEFYTHVRISFFEGSLEVSERRKWKHSLECDSRQILIFKEVRSYCLVFRQRAPKNDWERVVECLVHFIRSSMSPELYSFAWSLFRKAKTCIYLRNSPCKVPNINSQLSSTILNKFCSLSLAIFFNFCTHYNFSRKRINSFRKNCNTLLWCTPTHVSTVQNDGHGLSSNSFVIRNLSSSLFFGRWFPALCAWYLRDW